MNSTTTIAAILTVMLTVSSCAPIQRMEVVEQPLGVTLNAGIGDVVINVERMRNLENAFGASDIFGRTTNEGFSEIRFLGMRDPDTVVFVRRDVAILSNETTMSRSGGIYVPNTTTTTMTGTAGSVPFYGTSTTTGGGTYIPAPESDTQVLPPDTFEIEINLKEGNDLVIGERTITILDATPRQISFQIN